MTVEETVVRSSGKVILTTVGYLVSRLSNYDPLTANFEMAR